MRPTLWLTALVLCPFVAFAGEKGEKGERKQARADQFAFILEHEKELKLTDPQKKDLKELSEQAQSRREKLMESPEGRAIAEQMRQARKNGDESTARELREKLMETAAKDKDNDSARPMQQMMKILTPEQLAKLRELREKEGMPTLADMKDRREDRKGKGGEKNYNKPDPSSGVPKLYDEEK